MSNVPNLDAMEYDELMRFWAIHQNGRKFIELFPNGGYDAMKATKELSKYAGGKATAFYSRQEGKIAFAMQYESLCDKIYEQLPEFARW